MPTFDTPEPISAILDVVVGDIEVRAADRTDTVVTIRPSDPSRDLDVKAADQTRVEYDAGRLRVKTPRQKKYSVFGKIGSVDVTVELPAGSSLQADAPVASIRCEGRLGETRIKLATGGIEVEYAESANLHTSAGAISADVLSGAAEISTGSGQVRVGRIDGSAVVKNSNGHTRLGLVTGELRVSASNGDIAVARADSGVTAKTSNGAVRVADFGTGTASLRSAFGDLEIGVRAGTAVRFDANTRFGRVHNELDSIDDPGPVSAKAEVTAQTGYGDIVIRRATGEVE